ncbi:DNA-formamidopyrimidine glycosylase [Aerosakkonema funiforme]|uniref:Formamidopyrimidine-DNA glycosylase n=1 Tax=Aerosakkonema funiforme FACHB-1375 TaxID=2949571 RepID=A0A926VBF5_9CYAN|nr:DNA-formamidopyrimidine glycosylase [Aerosakkonema funiforme]MBD2180450.1 DNA-formamidopyrimidine glycosylase [Aerosakkonema funiforme FACHB-1375]
MPELPEVETVKRGLDRVTLNCPIEGGDVLLPRTVAHPFSVADFLSSLSGVKILQWHRRGKYLLAELVTEGQKHFLTEKSTLPQSSNTIPAGWLGVHLRMTGQLLWLHRDEPLQKHTRVRLFFAESRELRFVDQRTFGQMWWVPPTSLPEDVISGLKKLGPDPFSAEFSIDYFAKQLQNSRRPIKTALLDQELVAGLGNIYADEVLFLSKVHPTTLCSELKRDGIERLHDAIVRVLQTAIEAGGTTFSNFLNVQGINGNYGGVAWVYKRAGEPCRLCGTSLERIKLAGRSSHFCPQCQK